MNVTYSSSALQLKVQLMFGKYNSYKARFKSSVLSVTFPRFVLISISSDGLPIDYKERVFPRL